MTQTQLEVKDVISIFLGLIAVVIPVFFFFISSPEEITFQTILIFGLISVLLLVGSIGYYLRGRWRMMHDLLMKHGRETEHIKRSLNFKELFDAVDVRLRVLEKLMERKKGQLGIDPRVLWWILILILLYLFLKSIGVVS
ncbi:MAG TPA: hypothetical protein VJK51_03615 [Candidatus Nanoarchaeia archaeon]|nr:hypothetical protein [Candidatus Nanoarchaeia archaeon]